MPHISENEVEKLLPCPFCGGKAEIDAGWAQCSERQCFMSDTGINPKIWNTRSDLTGAVSGGEALEIVEELSCTCDERFMLETKCPKCRLSDVFTRQPVETKPVEQEEFIEKTGYVDIYDKIIASGFIITRKD